MTILFECISGYGMGFHGPIKLALGKDKSLNLFVMGDRVWTSAPQECPDCKHARKVNTAKVKRYRAKLKVGPRTERKPGD